MFPGQQQILRLKVIIIRQVLILVKTNQAFRPHVLDMFEPQDHPNDFLYPGGPPVAPYDMAGWTPAYTMGFKFKRILNAFDGPFQPIPYGEIQSPQGVLTLSSSQCRLYSGFKMRQFIYCSE